MFINHYILNNLVRGSKLDNHAMIYNRDALLLVNKIELPTELNMELSITLVLILMVFTYSGIYSVYTYGQKDPTISRPFPFDHRQNEPYLLDPNLKIEEVVNGLEAPTTMAFLGQDDFLVLEKDKGTVLRVMNGKF